MAETLQEQERVSEELKKILVPLQAFKDKGVDVDAERNKWETLRSIAFRPVGPSPARENAQKSLSEIGGFEICIDGLSFWLMRIVREIGRGTSVQAVWE